MPKQTSFFTFSHGRNHDKFPKDSLRVNLCLMQISKIIL